MSIRETEALARPGAPIGGRPIVAGPPIVSGPPIVTGPPAGGVAPKAVGDPPNITGINPPHAAPGTNVEIDGNNFTNVIGVTFGPLGAAFKNDSTTVVHAIVPPGLYGPTGVVVVTEPPTGTQIDNSLPYPFTIDRIPPVIAGFQPSHAVTGAAVQITGTALSSVTTVSFNGVQAQFNIVSDTVINATVPDAATTGKISVSDGVDTPSYSANPFTVDPTPPSIDGFDPPAGIVGQTITIVGRHLSKVNGVFFNKVSAKIVNQNPGQPQPNQRLMVIVPQGATTGPVHLDSPNGGTTSSPNFVVILPPQPASVTPSSGRAGTKVTLAGKHLGELTSATVNGQHAKFTEKSEKSVKVTIPSVAPGPATILVVNAAGQAQIAFTVTA